MFLTTSLTHSTRTITLNLALNLHVLIYAADTWTTYYSNEQVSYSEYTFWLEY